MFAPPREYESAVPALVGQAGYAHRLSPQVSVDGGVMRSQFFDRFAPGESTGYTEAYLGASSRLFSAHLFYSPNYYRPGVHTLYMEADGSIETVAQLRLNAHVGMLDYLRWPGVVGVPTVYYDWRIGVSRQFGPLNLSGALTGGGPGRDYYEGEGHSKTAVVVAAGWSF